MNHHHRLSSYLVRPNLVRRRRRRWNGFSSALVQIQRHRQGPSLKYALSAGLWVGIATWLHFVSGLINHPVSSSPNPGSSHTTASTLTATLASATRANALPGGPSGQLLPPGTMAPDYTYPNSYARGQCTWYVAGRRQIPSNWGNAVRWYYNASASGWSVGATPAVAAIAWTPSGPYGHVALVEQVSTDGKRVYVSEMNYKGRYVKSYRWVTASSFKYIY